MALKLAKEGGNIIIWDIDDQAMARVEGELKNLGGKVKTYHCDVSERQVVYKVAAEVLKEFGRVDILINNAGRVSGKDFLDIPDEMIESTFRLNALAYFWTIKAFLPKMIEQNRGHVVNLSSAAGIVGVYRLADYSACKFANIGMDESLRFELKRKKINVKTTIVCPYYIDTGMFKGVKTRFPLLLPILNEGKVADRIVWAIKKSRKRVVMPWMVYTVWLLRLLPPFFCDFMANFFGINNTMDEFVGREGKKI
jgi:all-trans-retinol dehydrogenase (NAD+)